MRCDCFRCLWVLFSLVCLAFLRFVCGVLAGCVVVVVYFGGGFCFGCFECLGWVYCGVLCLRRLFCGLGFYGVVGWDSFRSDFDLGLLVFCLFSGCCCSIWWFGCLIVCWFAC